MQDDSIEEAEEWRQVPEYEGVYSVSSWGRIKRDESGHILSMWPNGNGYYKVQLWRDGKYAFRNVHRLVLLVFRGPLPNGLQSRHNDGNKLNNRITNLRYDTPKSNCADKAIHGTNNLGENNGSSKLALSTVKEIRDTYAKGELSQRKLAKKYKVCQTTIGKIIRNENWQHDLLLDSEPT